MATRTITQIELIEQPTQDVASHHEEQLSQISATSSPLTDRNQLLPRSRGVIVVVQLAGINFLTSFSNGFLTIALPAIAASLQLPSSLLLWPSAAFSLTCGTCLLLAGAVADVLGPRPVALTGSFFIAAFTAASGLSRDPIQLIVFRALQGIATALTLPSSISIISTSIESGKRRNIGFATLGLAMPLGFSFGLVLGGLLVSGPGWRVGFYIGGAASFLLALAGVWALPATRTSQTEASVWRRLGKEIDWVGAAIASTALALFSYVLAYAAPIYTR